MFLHLQENMSFRNILHLVQGFGIHICVPASTFRFKSFVMFPVPETENSIPLTLVLPTLTDLNPTPSTIRYLLKDLGNNL